MNKIKNILILLILAAVGYPLSKQALPLFSKLFMGYPTLEETTLYEGTVEVKGEDCFVGSCPPLIYYVNDATGSHEIYWVLPGGKFKNWYPKIAIQGATGKFWFDPEFGVVQEDFTMHKNSLNSGETEGERIFHSIHENRSLIAEHFNWTKHWIKALPFIAYLIVFVRVAYKLFNDKTNSLKD
jgi:hypothetical protein